MNGSGCDLSSLPRQIEQLRTSGAPEPTHPAHPLHLPALLRQASAQLDRDLARLLEQISPVLTPEGFDALITGVTAGNGVTNTAVGGAGK